MRYCWYYRSKVYHYLGATMPLCRSTANQSLNIADFKPIGNRQMCRKCEEIVKDGEFAFPSVSG